MSDPVRGDAATRDAGYENQHEKNLRILGLIRDDRGWALTRVLLAERLEHCLADVRSVLDAYSDDDGPGAALVALGKIGQRVYSEVTGV